MEGRTIGMNKDGIDSLIEWVILFDRIVLKTNWLRFDAFTMYYMILFSLNVDLCTAVKTAMVAQATLFLQQTVQDVERGWWVATVPIELWEQF